MTNDPCMSYCEHGGVCMLENGHKGLHDSRYCQWDDEHSLTKDEADEIMVAKNPILGRAIADQERAILKAMGKIK